MKTYEMGSGRDKKKKKSPNAPGHGAAKTAAKTSKREEKEKNRLAKRVGHDEDDIDALLAAMALEDARNNAVIREEDVPVREISSSTDREIDRSIDRSIVFFFF